MSSQQRKSSRRGSHVQIWRVAFQAYLQLRAGDFHLKLLGADTRWDFDEEVYFLQRLIPLVYDPALVSVLVALGRCKLLGHQQRGIAEVIGL